jgi:hypothetical protein
MTRTDFSKERKQSLKATKQKLFKRKLFSLDIETSSNKNNFVCATVYGENDESKFFRNKRDLINYFKTDIFINSWIAITNIQFDFFRIFEGEPEEKEFNIFKPKSQVIFIKSNIIEGEFTKNYLDDRRHEITFIDTLNLGSGSVSNMGKIIKIEKLVGTAKVGEIPKNNYEWYELERYNRRDAEITFKFMKFFISTIEKLGCTMLYTIASTSMSLFRNKYLKTTLYQPKKEILDFQFLSYYGGRVEVFKRGLVDKNKIKVYDINSMYGSVMRECEYPNPNSLKITHKNTCDYINFYDGCSDVDVYIPKMKVSPLPLKVKGRTIYPTGNISGVWCHNELRNAVKYGCVITKVRTSHYYTENFKPFSEMIGELYTLRMKFQEEGNEGSSYICKTIINSSYGKFAQKSDGYKELIHESYVDLDMLDNNPDFTKIDNYFEFTKQPGKNANFCIPIIASYVTSHARIKLYEYLINYEPLYCDTDSLFTFLEIESSKELGKMKLEISASEGYIVRKKMYALKSDDEDSKHDKVRHKGIPNRVIINGEEIFLDYNKFKEYIQNKNPEIYFNRFTKWRYAKVHKYSTGEIIEDSKRLDLNDTSRNWSDKNFNPLELQDSEPINIIDFPDYVAHVIPAEIENEYKPISDDYKEFFKTTNIYKILKA